MAFQLLKYSRTNVTVRKVLVFLVIKFVDVDAIYGKNYSNNVYDVNKTEEMSTATPDYFSDYDLAVCLRIDSEDCMDKYSCLKDKHTFPDKGCHCDKICGLMHDCCEDFYYGQMPYLYQHQFECVPLYEIVKNKDYGITMVTKCSSSWDNFQIMSMCESVAKINDSLLRIPVSDKTEYHVMYKNIYCAICNFVNDVYFWKQVVRCRNETGVRTLSDMKECTLSYFRPKPDISYRTCQMSKTIVSSCNFSEVSTLAPVNVEKCENGTYAVTYDTYGKMYRNEYCAMCNGVEKESMCCKYIGPITNDTESIIMPGDPYKIPYSLRRILDTNTCQLFQNDKIEKIHKCNASEVLVIANDFSEECVGILGHSYVVCGIKVTPQQVDIVFHSEVVERYLTLFGLVLSIISLVLTLVIYLSFPKLLNIPGKILVSLVISLLSAQMVFILAPEVEGIQSLCIVVGIMVHYFFLVAFCWMNVIAFDLWMTFSKRNLTTESINKGKKRFLVYSAYAWLLPSIIVCIAVFLDFAMSSSDIDNYKPKYGNAICWISSRKALILFFAGPFAVFKIFDIIAFISTAFIIARTRKQAAMARRNRRTCSFLINIKLSVIMGLTWVFAFLGNVTTCTSVWYMFIIFNSLQGLFIAICFLCNKRVIRIIWSRCKCFSSKDTNDAQ